MKNLMYSTRALGASFALFLLLASAASPQDPVAPSCYRASLSGELNMVNSVAAHGDHVLVADIFKDQILAISGRAYTKIAMSPLSAQTAGEIGLPDLGKEWIPARVRAQGDKLYVLLRRNRTSQEADVGPWFGIFELEGEADKPTLGDKLWFADPNMVVRDFEIVTDDQSPRGVLLYASLVKSREEPEPPAGTFLYYDLASDQRYVVETVESEVEHSVYAYLNTRFMASLGSQAFILLYRETGVVLKTFEMSHGGLNLKMDGRVGLRTINEIPLRYRKSNLPSSEILRLPGPERAAYLLRELGEDKPMVMGIYPWKETLHLLVRDPMKATGKSTWRLKPLRLQTTTGTSSLATAALVLPTDAPHLSISMNGDYWRLVEKDRVQTLGRFSIPYTKTTKMAFMPTEWLQNPPTETAVAKCMDGLPSDVH